MPPHFGAFYVWASLPPDGCLVSRQPGNFGTARPAPTADVTARSEEEPETAVGSDWFLRWLAIHEKKLASLGMG